MKKRGVIASLLMASVVASVALAADLSSARAQQQGKPGDFDYYALVMSWSPSYCGGEGQGRGDPQCAPSRAYSFVLHGLWPQYTRGFPESCRTSFNPFVPQPVINGILDIMPSPRLVIHEYRKHGTCSGLEPRAYFDKSRALFNKIKIPEAYRNLDRPLVAKVADVSKAFVEANPGLKPEMFGIVCSRPNRLKEIRFCFSKEGELKTCGANENQGRLCRSPNVYLPPVRAAAGRSSAPPSAPTPPATSDRKT